MPRPSWRPAHVAPEWQNSFVLPGVASFVKSLTFFAQTGKIAIIINRANDKGVEHANIGQDDLVSEFVWIWTASYRKRLTSEIFW